MDENFNNEIAKQVTSAILDKYLSPVISKQLTNLKRSTIRQKLI